MVNKSLYHVAHVNVSRNAFFSSRSEKKNNIFFDVDIVVKNKSKCVFSWYVLLSITSTRRYSFPKHFFELVLHIKRVWKVFERVWRVQAAHLHNAEHNAERALSNPSRWTHEAQPSQSTTFWPLWWRVSLSIKLYIITQVILAFWLVLAYDLLEDRCTIDVIITSLSLCRFKMAESFEN